MRQANGEMRRCQWSREHIENAQSVMPARSPKVVILLGTYHGQDYLAVQLDSFAAQTYSNWEVWASDDGSRDNTRGILECYRRKWRAGRLYVQDGPAAGHAANFLSLTRQSITDASFFAYSDQDDIWEPDRLTRALAWLNGMSAKVPALYCSRTRYISQQGVDQGFSTMFRKPPSFRNALVQSIAGGNTMVFNQATRDLLVSLPEQMQVVAHDWWAYMLVTGAGGHVLYDEYPGVRYRQHGNNIAGQNVTVAARIARVKALWRGRFQQWNDINLLALDQLDTYLTQESVDVKQRFKLARQGNVFSRCLNLYRSGVYRQTLAGNVGLCVAALFNKL